MAAPLLSGLVVHWHAEAALDRLVAAWPGGDQRFELIVVDNGSRTPLALPPGVVVERPGRNLGFAGGVNRAAALARAPLLLVLNPDVEPTAGALDALLEGFAAHPEAAGIVPRLIGPQGEEQAAWQLRPLPRATQLLLHALFVDGPRGPAQPPPAGSAIAQPAAAALGLRRAAFDRLGGFDEGFFPAWFEDVDFAARAAALGAPFLYWPAATLRHARGASVDELGYGGFLVAYQSNLARYLGKHHGGGARAALRLLAPLGLALRLALVPLRAPRAAASRRAAAAGLLTALGAALRGWRGAPLLST